MTIIIFNTVFLRQNVTVAFFKYVLGDNLTKEAGEARQEASYHAFLSGMRF